MERRVYNPFYLFVRTKSLSVSFVLFLCRCSNPKKKTECEMGGDCLVPLFSVSVALQLSPPSLPEIRRRRTEIIKSKEGSLQSS